MDYTPLFYALGAGAFGGFLYSWKNNLLNKDNEASAAMHTVYGALAAFIAVFFVGLAYPAGIDASMLPAIGVGYIGTEYIGQFVSNLPGGSTPPAPPATPPAS